MFSVVLLVRLLGCGVALISRVGWVVVDCLLVWLIVLLYVDAVNSVVFFFLFMRFDAVLVVFTVCVVV